MNTNNKASVGGKKKQNKLLSFFWRYRCLHTNACTHTRIPDLYHRSTCSITYADLLFAPNCLKRTSKTRPDFQQRSDFSLGMSLGFRHKSLWIHIFQLGHGFCPGEWRTRSWPCKQPAPPGVHCQGQPNVWPAGPLTDVPLPCHVHGIEHTHSHACTFYLALKVLPHARYNTLGPHQTKSPTAPLESNGFAPKDGSSRARGLQYTDDKPLPTWTLLHENNSPSSPKCPLIPHKSQAFVLKIFNSWAFFWKITF